MGERETQRLDLQYESLPNRGTVIALLKVLVQDPHQLPDTETGRIENDDKTWIVGGRKAERLIVGQIESYNPTRTMVSVFCLDNLYEFHGEEEIRWGRIRILEDSKSRS